MFSLNFQVLLLFPIFFCFVEYGQSLYPKGSSGCTKTFLPKGYCWRYCAGNSGKWCYTGSDCVHDNVENDNCDWKTTCSVSCGGGAVDCVNDCESNTLHFLEEYSGKPIGATGCSRRFSNGWCWRYCHGTSGNWCYTTGTCIDNTEKCAEKTECGGYSCDGAAGGCVSHCPNRGPNPPVPPRK